MSEELRKIPPHRYQDGNVETLFCDYCGNEKPHPIHDDRLPFGKELEPIQGTAADVIRNMVDVFQAKGIPVASRHKGMIGRQAKELLADGFDVGTVTVAAVIALKRSEPQNLHFIANDLVMARAGEKMTRREYERALQDEMEVGR